jgi:pSer/pThr/pTyr-binding forkhead associated (FHA) protein
VLIGRTVDNDVQIESKFVSRHHCQITTTFEGSILEDLNSTNGVYVKSKRVRRHHLNDGDVVVLGKHEIMYLDERSARARGGAIESTGDHPEIGDVTPGGEDAPDGQDEAGDDSPAAGTA